MAKLTLTDIATGYAFIATYNANNTLIEAAMEKTLSRDGTTPNTMSAAFDMNSQKLTNLAAGTNNSDGITLKQLNDASIVALTIAASAVTVADAGGFLTATTAEAALAEVFEAPSATTRRLLELATQSEVNTGTDTVRAVTPSTLGSRTRTHLVQIKAKTADETINSSGTGTTMQNDNHLVGITLDAASYYKLEMGFTVTQLGGDFKCRWLFSNAPQDGSAVAHGSNNTGGELIGDGANGDLTADSTISLNVTNEGTKHDFTIIGYFRTNASTGGTIGFQWAQLSADADNTTLHRGAWMSVTKIQ